VGYGFGATISRKSAQDVGELIPGRLALQAISARDYPLVQASVLVISVIYVFLNLAVDLIYVYLDPRIRYQ